MFLRGPGTSRLRRGRLDTDSGFALVRPPPLNTGFWPGCYMQPTLLLHFDTVVIKATNSILLRPWLCKFLDLFLKQISREMHHFSLAVFNPTTSSNHAVAQRLEPHLTTVGGT